MEKSAAILDSGADADMNLRLTQPTEVPPAGAGMKFAHASGSRPLDGYTIKRGVGRGGFGEVYYATSDAGKEVALKLIRRNLDIELRGVSQCLNLKHPNLLGLFDIRQDDLGDSWVVMEFIHGESLEDHLGRHPNGLPVADAMAWFHGIAAGVGYLHDHGIVHRDLKPGNIFCDEGLVKVGDYGLSKFISASRRSGQTESVGTVHYMAPEIGHGRYGREIDIYALGIILYEMLTGHVPFDGESVGEVLMKHLTAEPNLTALAEPFRSAVARTLAKDPERRLKTVAELAAFLPAADGKPPHVATARPGAANPNSPHPDGKKACWGGGPAAAAATAAATAAAARAKDFAHSDEEPLLRAVRAGWTKSWQQISESWERWPLPPFLKGLIIVGAIILMMHWVPAFLGTLISVAFAYLVYRIIRSIVLAHSVSAPHPATVPPGASPPPHVPLTQVVAAAEAAAESAAAAAEQAVAAAHSRAETHHRRRRGLAQTLVSLPHRSPREKLTELLGSLMMSSVVVGVVSIVMAMVYSAIAGHDMAREQFGWMMLVSTIGSWTVLALGKFWEGRAADATLRRFVLLVCGLGLGAVSIWSQEALLTGLPMVFEQPSILDEIREGDKLSDMVLSVAYFGFLMTIIRWWRQTDPLRSTRLSVWRTIFTVAIAWLVSLLWPFPQPWGLMVAGAMSAGVQLASPWFDPKSSVSRVAA